MKCPGCQEGELHYTELEPSFPSQKCDVCEGHWIILTDYLSWQSRSQQMDAAHDIPLKVEMDESKQALLCPVSGKLMLKYRISHRTSHRLDLSPSVNGIWLDKGEWELLKQERLTDKLNHIFTDPWQKAIQKESAHETFKALYARRFGEDNYAHLKEIRTWLDQQEHRAEILAYLIAKDPYSAIR